MLHCFPSLLYCSFWYHGVGGTKKSIAGRVTIERYLPAVNSGDYWLLRLQMLLHLQFTNSWKEGGAPLTSNGYGTRITETHKFWC
jgi:hypothetical protein